MTPELLEAASRLSVVALLMLIIWGGYKKWWVFGWTYQQSEREKEEWKATALQLAGIAKAVVGRNEP